MALEHLQKKKFTESDGIAGDTSAQDGRAVVSLPPAKNRARRDRVANGDLQWVMNGIDTIFGLNRGVGGLTPEKDVSHTNCVLSHRIRRVLPPLAPHVDHLWMARGYLPRHWRNLILPDGAVEIIINLGDPQTLCALDDPEERTVFQRSWISGERTEPLLIEEAGYVHLVGIRLRPGGGWPFLGIPMLEFSGRVIELEEVLGAEINELRDRLGEKTTDDARFDLLEGWLLRRQRTPPTRAVIYALREIQRGADAMRIGRLAEEIGISHKHFLREFDRCVGLTPKKLSRLCAFQRVIQSVGQRREVEWAHTARKCGYYDQAHLIREFRAFSGLTPAGYLGKRGPFLNYVEV